MDIKEALEIAKKYIENINFCEEREDSFTFGYDGDGEKNVGGLGSPCVIYKETGEVKTFHQYGLDHIKTGIPGIIREMDI